MMNNTSILIYCDYCDCMLDLNKYNHKTHTISYVCRNLCCNTKKEMHINVRRKLYKCYYDYM